MKRTRGIFGRSLGIVLMVCLVGCASLGTGQAPPGVFYGNLHAHTDASDGTGSLEEAVQYARDTAKLDFFAVTDHDYLLNPQKYQRLLDLAASQTTTRFLVLPGFEWSSQEYGHVVVLGSRRLTDIQQTKTLHDLASFSRQETALLIVAHPALIGRSERTFREFEGNDVIVGVEIGSAYDWPSSSYSYRRYDLDALSAFAKGWHLGVGIGQDNHHGFWGGVPIDPAVGKGRTGWIGVVAPTLQEADITKALKLGRTFGTEDRALKIVLSANEQLMGGSVTGEGPLHFTIEAAHPELATSRVVLYEDNYENPIAVLNPRSASMIQGVVHTADIRPHAYFVRVELPDGRLGWSSPIWRLVANDVRAIAVWSEPELPVAGQSLTVKGKLVNRGTMPAEKIGYRIYDVGRSQLVGEGQVTLMPGEGKEVSVGYKTPVGAQDVQLRLALLARTGDYVGDDVRTSTVQLCPNANSISVGVSVSRDFGQTALLTSTVSAAPCAKALDALQLAANIEYAGGLVYGINGVGSPAENTSTKIYWCFAVNGQMASEGVGTYRLKGGDKVAFDLHSWVDEDSNAGTCTAKKK
jgi:hypothetical protein